MFVSELETPPPAADKEPLVSASPPSQPESAQGADSPICSSTGGRGGDGRRESGVVAVHNPTADRQTLAAATTLLQRFSCDLEVEVLQPAFAGDILNDVCRLEKLCAGIKTLVSARAAAASDWKAKGERSAAHWLARKTGTSVGNAADLLETAERVAALPKTQKALRTGQISEVQAKHIASAAGKNPGFESELLDSAEKDGFGSFVQRCHRLRATSGDDAAAKHRAIYSRRYLRKWTDPTGAFRLDGSFTQEHGAEIWAALAPYRQAAFEQARASRIKQPFDAYAADALLALSRDSREGMLETDSCDGEPTTDPREGKLGADSRQGKLGADPREGPAADSREGKLANRPAGNNDGEIDPDEVWASGATTKNRSSREPSREAGRNRALDAERVFEAEKELDPTGVAAEHDPSAPNGTSCPPTGRGTKTKKPRSGRDRPPVCIDILVDYNALVRGQALPGEICEIEGIGPVPVETVKALQNDAYLWVLLTDGHDIKSVSRMGRYISPRLRKALMVRDRRCVVPGCDVNGYLEIDHVQPLNSQGPTTLDNLALLCRHHHQLKTYQGFRLTGKPGDWHWHEPKKAARDP